jgi:hypothetical protein
MLLPGALPACAPALRRWWRWLAASAAAAVGLTYVPAVALAEYADLFLAATLGASSRRSRAGAGPRQSPSLVPPSRCRGSYS